MIRRSRDVRWSWGKTREIEIRTAGSELGKKFGVIGRSGRSGGRVPGKEAVGNLGKSGRDGRWGWEAEERLVVIAGVIRRSRRSGGQKWSPGVGVGSQVGELAGMEGRDSWDMVAEMAWRESREAMDPGEWWRQKPEPGDSGAEGTGSQEAAGAEETRSQVAQGEGSQGLERLQVELGLGKLERR